MSVEDAAFSDVSYRLLVFDTPHRTVQLLSRNAVAGFRFSKIKSGLFSVGYQRFR